MIRSLIFVLIMIFVWLLNNSVQEAPNENIQVTKILGTEEVPDYYSETLQLQQFNEHGDLQSIIKTARLMHYPDQQQALLESPELVMYGRDGDVWKVTSATGKIADNSRDLTLNNDVLLRMFNKENQQKIIIKTADMHYNAIEQVLWTDNEIIAETDNGNFVSTGLQILLKTEQILLMDKVKIHYEL